MGGQASAQLGSGDPHQSPSLTIPPKNAHIVSLLACLAAHLHHPRTDLAIPVFSNPWFCFDRELNQLSIHCSYQNPQGIFSGLNGQERSCLRNNRLMKVLCKKLSSAITAVQYRALSSKHWKTQIKHCCIAVWQQSTQPTGLISQVSKGFPCYGDVL